MSFFGMFLHFVLAFLFTVLIFYQLVTFPPLWCGVIAVCLAITMTLIVRFSPLLAGLSQKNRGFRQRVHTGLNILFGLIIGLSWAFLQSFFTPVIPESLLNQPVWISGQIIEASSQPSYAHKSRFTYKIQLDKVYLESKGNANATSKVSLQADNAINERTYQAWSKPIVSVNWYVSDTERLAFEPLPELGEVWQMRVKLKANHYSLNPGGFDYEAWLFQQHIAAKGYVKNRTKHERDSAGNSQAPLLQRIKEPSVFGFYQWQILVSERLKQVFSESAFSHFYKALTLGDKSAVSTQDWSILRNTGTIHLLAISGLHMGIVATLGYLLFKGLWWLGVYRIESVNLPGFAASGALLFATLYLTLSGFSIPTQRAWLMVVAVLFFVLIRRTFQPWSALGFAAFLIVVWDSRSVLSFGFWLSFIAVGLIFAALPFLRTRSKWQQLLWLQGLLTLGLAPFLIWAFHSLPLYSFIANLIAVPFISFIGLPLLFLSALIGMISIEWGQFMIHWLDELWVLFWQYLQWLDSLPQSTVGFTGASLIWLLSMYTFIFALLILKSTRHKKIAFAGLLLTMISLMLPTNNRPQVDQAWLTILDVGQGQAVVVETKSSVLVYDTGPKMGKSLDGATLAVLPYLKSQGWGKIDTLVISHSDSDHAGGTLSLVQNLPVKEAFSGQPEIMNHRLKGKPYKLYNKDSKNRPLFSLCQEGESWQVDGVLFQILSPDAAEIGQTLNSDNDLSCVLKITASQHSILMTGDLSQRGEAVLIKQFAQKPQKLKSDLLIAGHHGSKYSTGQDWLNQVSPNKVVFSAGYLNRYRFPNKAVLKRIENKRESRPIQWWNTACSGALQFEVTKSGINLRQEARKSQRKWYHHACLNSQQGHLFQ
jgi:competence protein ComEC